MSYRVLIVDDDPLVAHSLRRTLRGESLDIFEAAGATAAIEILSREPIDVVISDHQMPGMTGTALLNLVRVRWPDTVRILLTAHADLQLAITALNEGSIHRLLTKPWNVLDVRTILQLCLRQLENQRDTTRQLEAARQVLRRQPERAMPAAPAVPPEVPVGAGEEPTRR